MNNLKNICKMEDLQNIKGRCYRNNSAVGEYLMVLGPGEGTDVDMLIVNAREKCPSIRIESASVFQVSDIVDRTDDKGILGYTEITNDDFRLAYNVASDILVRKYYLCTVLAGKSAKEARKGGEER